MDCSRFSEILADLLEGTLSIDEQSAAHAHLAACPACGRLTAIARGDIDILSQDRHDALTHSILERTSGPVCNRVESSLWDFIDGELSTEDAHLISLHLESCVECRSVAEDLVLMQHELPGMAEIDPGESFTREVVSAAQRLRHSRIAIKGGIRTWWDRMVQRPRFALEAAYVGTLVLFIAFGLSSLSLQTVSFGKVSSSVIQSPSKIVVSAWTGTKTRISDQLSAFTSAVAAGKQTATDSVSELAKGCGSKSASVLDRSIKGIQKWQKDQSIGWLIVWRNMSSWMPLAKV